MCLGIKLNFYRIRIDSRKMFVQFLWSFYVILQFWFLCRRKNFNMEEVHLFLFGGGMDNRTVEFFYR